MSADATVVILILKAIQLTKRNESIAKKRE